MLAFSFETPAFFIVREVVNRELHRETTPSRVLRFTKGTSDAIREMVANAGVAVGLLEFDSVGGRMRWRRRPRSRQDTSSG